jgi:hypothetical protein
MDKDTVFPEKDNQSETIVSETTETNKYHDKIEKMPIESSNNNEIEKGKEMEKEANNGENDGGTKTAENTDKKRNSNEINSSESKKFEDDKNINSTEKRQNEEEEKDEKEIEEKKENEVSEYKIKGYEDILKKIINKKNEKINKIARKKFRFWKDKLNKMVVTKTILVRISVSREKDKKDRSNSDANINSCKRNFKKINDKILISNNTNSDIKKTNYKPLYHLRKIENTNSTENSSSTKKQKYNISNNLESIKKNITNFRNNNNILNSAKNQRTFDRRKIIEISNKKPEEKRNYIKVNVNKKLISTNRSGQKINNFNSKVDSNYKSYKVIPLGEKYIDMHKKENYNKNSAKLFYKKCDIKSDNKNSLICPSNKTKNQMKPMIVSSYNTKKNVQPKNIYTGKRINGITNFRNAFLNNSNNNSNSLNSSWLNKMNNKNMIFKNYSSSKNKKMKERFLDKISLRKGITTVFQHYNGICEELDNFIPPISYISVKL